MVVMRLENDTITTSKDVFDSFAPLEEGLKQNGTVFVLSLQ